MFFVSRGLRRYRCSVVSYHNSHGMAKSSITPGTEALEVHGCCRCCRCEVIIIFAFVILKGSPRRFTSLTLRIIPKNFHGMTRSDGHRGLRLSKSTVVILKGSQHRFTSLTLRIIPKNFHGMTRSDGHRGLRLSKSTVVVGVDTS